jgi:MFS family permease
MPWIGTSGSGPYWTWPSFWARIVQGLSSGFLFPAMPAIVNTLFPPQQRGLANGLMSSSVAVGSSAGVFLGPIVNNAVGGDWKSMFATISIVPWVCVVFAVIMYVAFNSRLFKHEVMPVDASGSSTYKKVYAAEQK